MFTHLFLFFISFPLREQWPRACCCHLLLPHRHPEGIAELSSPSPLPGVTPAVSSFYDPVGQVELRVCFVQSRKYFSIYMSILLTGLFYPSLLVECWNVQVQQESQQCYVDIMCLIQPRLPLQANHNKQAGFIYTFFHQKSKELIGEAMTLFFIIIIPYRVGVYIQSLKIKS